ncbi:MULTISPECIES: aminopeptidase P family protein [Ensifer]|jgi:Xaa-Pro aminopeptidase|uniref:M24 family metallopeptidase n=1 Tax=Ensifer canadensis TaxID=555315 RepID=A0AAW4FK19_9HYPH|nr:MULTISPECIES: aminopeptidase P family protein [Ensifer]AHK45275.1 conserved putative hydrolase/peptidase of the M24 family [Ensifer adhaerens OV14]MDP9633439.1 Xaa-Pro aminopeptidase [Ensifer adhaerens]MBD9490899.1 aminopeptidase P family protein [Ensifer sp. ENS11]MBM3091456.1 M24 family metallopeptidase [Ensifer canadensis]NOV20174.1 aminopeptidase P family protein [Ensifer canadensis]
MKEQTKARLAALRTKMNETGSGLVALAPGSHMDWLIGYHPHPDERPCLLLIGPQKEAFLMPALNAEGTREHTDIDFYNWSDAEGPVEALTLALAGIGAEKPGRVVIDETMRADFALLLIDNLPEDTARDFTPETLGALRMRKDRSEYELLKMNAGIADRAMQAAFAKIRPGMTEKELAAEIRSHFLSEGAAPAFWIVGAGGNGAFPHHSASERVIAEGDAVVIDIGGRKQGFPSDITRMAIVGRAPEGYGQIHTIVERAVQAALKAARPGVLAKTVDDAARKVIADAGYGEYFVHRTGHGMGIDGHEPPYITATSETVLEEGMVFSIEPGIYLPGRFGIRLEDIVILRADGPEVLSSLPRDAHIAQI